MTEIVSRGSCQLPGMNTSTSAVNFNPIQTRLFGLQKQGEGHVTPPPPPRQKPFPLLSIFSSKVFWKLVQNWVSWHKFGLQWKLLLGF